MTWFVLVVATLAVLRGTRLVTTDEVTAPLRLAVLRRWPSRVEPPTHPHTGQEMGDGGRAVPSWPVKLISCNWCVSFWLSGAVALGLHYSGFVPTWRWTVLAWWALAGSSGAALQLIA